MVFGKNTLRNTRTFKKSTSINTSNINTGSINPVPQPVSQPTSVSQGRQNYNTGYTSDWRLKDIINVGTVPTASAERGNDYKVEDIDTSNMSLYIPEKHDKNIKKEFNIFDTTTWFGEPTQPYNTQNAVAEEQQIQDEIIENTTTPESIYKDPQPLPKGLSGQGSFTNPLTEKTTLATKPEGSELFTMPDYVGQVERSSYYGLGKNVDSETFKKTLNKQQINKFENNIQREWSNLVRSGGVDDMSYLTIQQKITNSNLPIKEQERLIGVYSKKNKKLQNLTGGYDSVKTPNEAEQLGFKIADGTITRKELNKWNLLTGQDLPKSGKVTTKDGSMPRILTYEDLF